MFEGSHPTHSEYHDYPGEYPHKYPKAGQDNSKVSLWSYDMKNGKDRRRSDVPVDSGRLLSTHQDIARRQQSDCVIR